MSGPRSDGPPVRVERHKSKVPLAIAVLVLAVTIVGLIGSVRIIGWHSGCTGSPARARADRRWEVLYFGMGGVVLAMAFLWGARRWRGTTLLFIAAGIALVVGGVGYVQLNSQNGCE
jgi:hypothetical protein